MIRILGALFVIGASFVLGMNGVSALRKRVRTLDALINSLKVMSGEICSRLTPMREVLELLAEESPEPVSMLYGHAVEGMDMLGSCSFQSIWRDAVVSTPELGLREEETQVLSELGTCLGRYDVKDQAEAISRTAVKLESFLERAESERIRDSKVHAIFGLSAGIFAVVILL